MAIKVDQETCIGCGTCPEVCKEVFEMNDDGDKAKVIAQKNISCVDEAIEACPVDAISK